MLKNTPVKKSGQFCFYGSAPPASWSNLINRRQSLWLQSIFPVKVYPNSNFDFLVKIILLGQPEEDPMLDKILDKSFACFLCLVVTISNSERELNLVSFLEKI